jgi:beta-1,4-mannosyltransferase
MRDLKSQELPLHVVVIVLGDLGRSPRMLYHTQSLLREGHKVTLIGYAGEELMNLTSSNDSGKGNDYNNNQLTVIRLNIPEARFLRRRGLLPVYFVWRIVSLSLCLLYTLYIRLVAPVDTVLIQNPPAIPLLLISLLYCRTTQSKPGLVVDWHNVGYSMLPGNSASRTTRLARSLTKQYEQYFAKFAKAHFCVTQAMQAFLKQEMQIQASVLYDCPTFEPLTTAEQHDVLQRLHSQLAQACPKSWLAGIDSKYQTLLTEVVSETCVKHRPNRPWLLVSSTSWTPDEDFDLLLQALVELDQSISANNDDVNKVKVLVLITGKGPLREHYEQVISQLSPPLEHVCIQTIWLTASDYPKLIACSDLGLSLHTSTSGIDLPIKIQDCFGCGVPVLAKQFQCLSELLVDRVHGRVFETASELSGQLMELLGTTNGSKELESYRQAILKDRPRWHENWVQHGLPVIMAAASMSE